MYKQKDLKVIRDIILKEMNPYQILLFGSYAKGLQNENSDLDLMILMEDKILRHEKLQLIYRLQKAFLDLNYRIDIILKNKDEYDRLKGYIGTINYDVSQEGKSLWIKQ